MIPPLRARVFAICFLALTLPAIAQLDSAALRAKYGSPLNRETFSMPQGFDLIVDYGVGNQVCRLQVPALVPSDEKVSSADRMKQRMYEFLAELVPAAMRGKELRRMTENMGMVSLSSVVYEHVAIRELQLGTDPFDNNNKITVTFLNENCKPPAVR
jgi:hypothetical protein